MRTKSIRNYPLEAGLRFGTIGALICFFSLFTISCNETKEIGPDTLGYDFYPLNVGEYRIYEVQEIRYLVSGFDTTFYQLRETIFDSIPSADRITYLLRRDVRSNQLESWKSDSVWSVSRTANYLSITENNIPLIKLTFPVTAGKEWDGNSLNNRNPSTYFYESIEESPLDSFSGQRIRLVIADQEEDVTGVDLRSEVYAKGVGLLEKDYFTQLRCTESACGADLGKVNGGRLLKQTLIAIGNEE